MAHERTAIQTALRTDILASADQAVIDALAIRNDTLMTQIYNADTAFIVWKNNIQIMSVGKAVVYTAIAAMTAGNQTRVSLFVELNPQSFDASPDIDAMFQDLFSGTLGGGGAPSRAALSALLRRPARRAEALLATGTGTTGDPGNLVYDGAVSVSDISNALND